MGTVRPELVVEAGFARVAGTAICSAGCAAAGLVGQYQWRGDRRDRSDAVRQWPPATGPEEDAGRPGSVHDCLEGQVERQDRDDCSETRRGARRATVLHAVYGS